MTRGQAGILAPTSGLASAVAGEQQFRSQPLNKSRCVGLTTINKRHRIGHDTPHRYFLTVTGEMKPQDAKARASSPVWYGHGR